MKYTLGEAAKATGKSKSVIYKALKKGQISYESKDINGYQIDASELFRVFPVTVRENVLENARERMRTPQEHLDSLVKIAELQTRCDAAERRAEEWKQQAEIWQRESGYWREKVTALLEYQPREKKRWWSR
jgi:hypothetical protein